MQCDERVVNIIAFCTSVCSTPGACVAETWASPPIIRCNQKQSSEHFTISSPTTGVLGKVNAAEAATQTDTSLGVSLGCVQWTANIMRVEQPMGGTNAKLDLAMNAQQRDIIPTANDSDRGDRDTSDSDGVDSDGDGDGDTDESDTHFAR